VQQNEDYVLQALQDAGVVTRPQIERACSHLNGANNIVDVLVKDGVVSESDVSHTLAGQAHMDWIDISSMVIPPEVTTQIRAGDARRFKVIPARSRAEAEIAAMSTALESYKADNGIYPTNSNTDNLNPADANSLDYQNASRYLYAQVSGDSDGDPTTSTVTDTKNYMGSALRPNMLSPNPPGPNTYIRDPFGNSYGYSTAKASNPGGSSGYNPTFDLWSTANANPPNDQNQWIKNW
jgi:hypothetical protein